PPVHANLPQGTPATVAPTPADSQPPDQLPPRAPAVEGRGIWIEMKTLPSDEAGIRKLVASLARCHFNFLLVEVNYQRATVYPTALPPQDARFAGKDPLATLVAEAHAAQMEVHAWMWALKQGRYRSTDTHGGGPVLTRHPDWVALNQQGLAV